MTPGAAQPRPTDRRTSVFVGRETELARLTALLGQALSGQAAIGFVTGEPGQGKTTLLQEFQHRAQGADNELVVAVGECNAQTGIGDPYLPFREVMAVLTGDVESSRRANNGEGVRRPTDFLRVSARAVVESGPDLIGTFIPGGAFLTRVAAKLGSRVPWLSSLRDLVEGGSTRAADGSGREQTRIFEQYTNVLRRIARERPLLLVLDDLHWADAASIGLLFHLTRRLGDSRVLLVGAYRPADVSLGRLGEPHPLAAVLLEIRRYFGDVIVDLSADDADGGRRLVDGLVDAEPNRLDRRFREALLRRTEGHPLFTVELLRSLRDAGALARDEDGYWIEAQAVDWDALPARVEGVIQAQIERLEPGLADALSVAAVEGETFTAEVVARVRGLQEHELVRQLSATVEKRHGLVVARESQVQDGHRISRYQFRHNLFRTYLYQRLDPVERAYTHEGVGRELEALHGEHAGDIALELAHHYAEAGHRDRAVAHLLRGAERAAGVFANQEAVALCRQALKLMPEPPAATAARLHELLGEVLERIGQHEAARAEIDRALHHLPPDDVLGRARLRCMRGKSLLPEQKMTESLAEFELALEALGPERHPDDTVWWDAWVAAHLDQIWTLYLLNRPEELEALASKIEPIVHRLGNPRHRATLLQTSLMADYRREVYQASDRMLDRSRELLRAAEQVTDPRYFGSATAGVATGLFNMGFCHLLRREPELAEPYFRAALERGERSGDVWLQTLTLTYLAVLERQRGNEQGVGAYARRAREAAESAAMRLYVAVADANLAWLARREGRTYDARSLAEAALVGLDNASAPYPLAWMALWPLAGLAVDDGDLVEACRYVRRMIQPSQQRQPEPLDAALHAAVDAWDSSDTVAAASALRAAVPVAQELGYL